MTNFKPITLNLILIFSLLLVNIRPAQAQTEFANCRFGVGNVTDSVAGYDVEQLNLGLYSDWAVRASPPADLPGDITYIRTVRIHQKKVGSTWWGDGPYEEPYDYYIGNSLEEISDIASNTPGLYWVIGNEVDRRDWPDGTGGQDETTPEVYATAFHEISQAIKSADPTAKIGVAGVVQPTPLRFKYLDRVWDSYYSQYGYSMGEDVDFWTYHSFILREVYQRWGADIPSGLVEGLDYEKEEGYLYGADVPEVIAAHHDVEIYKQFVRNFRQWMADKGERNKPLLNSEYGVLYKTVSGIEITDAQIIDFLEGSFDFMLNETNDEIGFEADGNRLVQGWVWYSLEDTRWNGALFDDDTKTLTNVGTAWKNYVSDASHPFASNPQHNVLVSNLQTVPDIFVEPTGPVSFTMKVDVSNNGNIPIDDSQAIEIKFWDGEPNEVGSNVIGQTQINGLEGCAQEIKTVEMIWPNPGNTTNTWYVEVVPIADETLTSDNEGSSSGFIIDPAPQANLALTKTVDDDRPVEGLDKVTYIIEVTNSTGPHTATNVIVNDPLPEGITFAGYEASQGTYFSSGPWFLGALPLNQTATLTVTAKVDDDTGSMVITNTATISSSDSVDTQLSDNKFSVPITVGFSQKTYVPLVLKNVE